MRKWPRWDWKIWSYSNVIRFALEYTLIVYIESIVERKITELFRFSLLFHLLVSFEYVIVTEKKPLFDNFSFFLIWPMIKNIRAFIPRRWYQLSDSTVIFFRFVTVLCFSNHEKVILIFVSFSGNWSRSTTCWKNRCTINSRRIETRKKNHERSKKKSSESFLRTCSLTFVSRHAKFAHVQQITHNTQKYYLSLAIVRPMKLVFFFIFFVNKGKFNRVHPSINSCSKKTRK